MMIWPSGKDGGLYVMPTGANRSVCLAPVLLDRDDLTDLGVSEQLISAIDTVHADFAQGADRDSRNFLAGPAALSADLDRG